MINAFNFQQLITKPIRVTNISETLIDHVYSNNPENVSENAVPIFFLSETLSSMFYLKNEQLISKWPCP